MNEIRVCQQCGYQRGFHVSVRLSGDQGRLVLICPGCGQSYDPGWKVALEQVPPKPLVQHM
ncbi:MAG: hypothetical protein D6751_04695 [Deltaproteobacteria bacterium]|nr:MAG: hypothetical protein D6751_04695 [Deltaproteobacteria bacterium]